MCPPIDPHNLSTVLTRYQTALLAALPANLPTLCTKLNSGPVQIRRTLQQLRVRCSDRGVYYTPTHPAPHPSTTVQ